MKRWLLVLLIVGGTMHWWQGRPVHPKPGVLAPESPRQETVRDETIAFGDFQLQPLARFTVEARVLSREDYRLGAAARLSPTDLALGWGPMSDSSVLADLKISQRSRFYYYRWRSNPPIPIRHIVVNSANMHMIPADASVAAALKQVKAGQLVRFEGFLVNASRSDGWRWNSSTRRDDTGSGACELVWVRHLEVVEPL